MDKNPLDDVHNTNTINWVMKNGELFEGDTLNEVWPEQKKLEPLWFWNNYDAPKVGDPLSYGKTTQPSLRASRLSFQPLWLPVVVQHAAPLPSTIVPMSPPDIS